MMNVSPTPMSDELARLPETLKLARLRRKASVREVQAATGVNYGVISRFENRKSSCAFSSAVLLLRWIEQRP